MGCLNLFHHFQTMFYFVNYCSMFFTSKTLTSGFNWFWQFPGSKYKGKYLIGNVAMTTLFHINWSIKAWWMHWGYNLILAKIDPNPLFPWMVTYKHAKLLKFKWMLAGYMHTHIHDWWGHYWSDPQFWNARQWGFHHCQLTGKVYYTTRCAYTCIQWGNMLYIGDSGIESDRHDKHAWSCSGHFVILWHMWQVV